MINSIGTTRAAAPGHPPVRRRLPGARTRQATTPAHGPASLLRVGVTHRTCIRPPSAQPRPLESTPILHAGPPLSPTLPSATAFAPATVANLGPGFDWLGCAVDGVGDTVTAIPLPGKAGVVEISSIIGDGGRLPLDGSTNCCGVAAAHTLRLLGNPDVGVSLSIDKGLPLGSGLGSSAASAAAAAMAVNALFGSPLSKAQLVHAGLAAEAAVSGFHADNVAPALMGGFVLVRSTEPLDVRGLTYGGAAGCVSGDGAATPAPAAPAPLWFALVNPVFEAPTAAMRAALPPMVPFKDAVSNAGAGGALIAGILAGDPALVGLALGSDALVEPVRGPLIPGFAAVKAAAGKAGAYGCTISGAGPTCVAVVPDEATGRAVCAAMSAAFVEAGGLQVNSARVAALDPVGARVVVV